ncbi:hypothetical protein BGZ58_007463 [Dissophora ornata]|nr:hypothetical protein BGZ58_007463 [Dissophora ornata]
MEPIVLEQPQPSEFAFTPYPQICQPAPASHLRPLDSTYPPLESTYSPLDSYPNDTGYRSNDKGNVKDWNKDAGSDEYGDEDVDASRGNISTFIVIGPNINGEDMDDNVDSSNTLGMLQSQTDEVEKAARMNWLPPYQQPQHAYANYDRLLETSVPPFELNYTRPFISKPLEYENPTGDSNANANTDSRPPSIVNSTGATDPSKLFLANFIAMDHSRESGVRDEEDDDTKRLWYLREIGDSVISELQSQSKQPVAVPQDEDWKDKTCETFAENKELSQIKPGVQTRVRLHRQIELSKDGYVEFSIKAEATGPMKLKMHYIALERCDSNDLEDLVLYGEGKPQEFINIRHNYGNDGSNNTEANYRGKEIEKSSLKRPVLGVHSYDISSSGSHATTLCFHEDNHAIIEVWSLSDLDNTDDIKNGSEETPRRHTLPLARGRIEASAANHPDLMDICFSISDDGNYVAIHSNDSSIKGIPCHIFSHGPKAPAYENISRPRQLSQITLPTGLENYYGHGTFQFIPADNASDGTSDLEYYITCDGKALSIYKTTGNWERIRMIVLSFEPRLDAALDAFLGMRGRYFAWTGDLGVVSIWDLETCKQISHFQVEDGDAGTHACLSRDGSLVAVSVKGAITIHETLSGIKVAEYGYGLGDNNYFEIILENEFAIVLDQLEGKESEVKMVKRKVVRLGDMSVVREHSIHRDYGLRYPAPMDGQLLSYSQGSVVNIIRMDSKMIGAPEPRRFKDSLLTRASVDQIAQWANHTYTSSSGDTFNLSATTSVIRGRWMTVLTMKFTNPQYDSGSLSRLTIPLGTSHITYPTLFLGASSRLAIVTGRYLQVWKLSSATASDNNIAELELVWALQEEDEKKHKLSDICQRLVQCAYMDHESGAQFLIELQPARWWRRLKQMPIEPAREHIEVVTVPCSANDTLSVSLEYRVRQGIRGAVDMYISGAPACQKAVARYLRSLIRPSDENPVSSIVTLCKFWKHQQKSYFEKIMADLLPKTEITWIPETNAGKRDKEQDPLAILMKIAETQPAAIGVAKVIMHYCVSHANSSRNLSFLAPIFGSMHDVMNMFPEEALECLSRMAFIPAKDRSYIIDNHVIVPPPTLRLQFWRPAQKLSETREPIMQLCVSPTRPDPSNDKFTLPVFMASFDAIWFYNNDGDSDSDGDGESDGESDGDGYRDGRTLSRALATTTKTTDGEAIVGKSEMSRWKILFHMIRLKSTLQSKMFVECYDFNLEFFENPAIAALVAYKW